MIKEFTEKCSRSLKDNGAVTIVALGDSVTQGCFGQDDGFSEADSYTLKLRKMLKFLYPNQVFNIINAGISGTTATFAVPRLERDVLRFKPDLVTVMFGVNDFGNPEAYEAALSTIFKTLKAEGIPTVFITEHMMNTYVYEKGTAENFLSYAHTTAEIQTSGRMDEMFDIARRVATEYAVPVCDMYSKWKQLNALGVDTTRLLANSINHPLPQMHTMLAYELLSLLLFE